MASIYVSIVAVTGTWSEGRVQPRAFVILMAEIRSPSAGVTQMVRRRPLSAKAQSGGDSSTGIKFFRLRHKDARDVDPVSAFGAATSFRTNRRKRRRSSAL